MFYFSSLHFELDTFIELLLIVVSVKDLGQISFFLFLEVDGFEGGPLHDHLLELGHVLSVVISKTSLLGRFDCREGLEIASGDNGIKFAMDIGAFGWDVRCSIVENEWVGLDNCSDHARWVLQ